MYRNEDFFQVFGHISVFFTTLDFFVTATLLQLVDKDKRVRAIAMADRTTLQQKFRLFEKLEERQVIDHALLGEIKSILPRALTVGERRNRFVHDLWKFAPNDISAGRIGRSRIQGLDRWTVRVVQEEETTIDELYTFLREIGTLQKDFGAFLGRLPPLPPVA